MSNKKIKVLHLDDERNIGNSIIVTLNNGWCFDGIWGHHVEGFDTTKDANQAIKESKRCGCKLCLQTDSNVI